MSTEEQPEKKKRKPNPALMRPVQPDELLAVIVGSDPIPRSEITKKLWDYIKGQGLQTKIENGAPQNAKKYIVADAKLVCIFKNTKSTSKSGKLIDLTSIREGETINMMQMAAVVGAKVE